ncbi:monoacylglycerol lipase ABHD6 [Solea senegalensis]|uniref:Monoacylglycerol lipase ABHD6 n=1 Tax=Solea senegalensis TaxID=28829 RepID=A0AAV6QP93_SOLSE|nr:monoacylglycerol lipase abhd6-B-like [Solea senegalensis]KAG7495254.1 monoacylglycerol lipase ABHD6 [Solea senegalensis]
MEPSVIALLVSAGGIVVLLIFVYVTFLLCPAAYLRAYNWYQRRKLGLVTRFSHSGSYRFCYFTSVTPAVNTPSLLLLHGFSATKDMWLPLIKYLPKNQHVVAMDMPGHGGTARTVDDNYSIECQVTRVHQFVQSIGLDKSPFHLVGTSMGGNVAGVYAARYPTYLSNVTLICPAGLVYPKDSEFVTLLKELEGSQNTDSIPLIPTTVQEYENMMRLCFHKSLNLPRPVLRGLLSERIPNNGFYKEVFMELIHEESRHSLQENLNLITTPLQVIWGKEDKLLDVSGTTVVQAVLPNCRVELLDNCGHSVSMERPRKAAKLIMDFMSVGEVNNLDVKKHS